MRLFWQACPSANPLVVGMEAAKSWNVTGLRWLLGHKIGDVSSRDLVRLFEGACSSGSALFVLVRVLRVGLERFDGFTTA
jgi:hypothetical protein